MTGITESTPAWDISALQAELPRHVLTGSMRYADFKQLGQGGKAEVFRCQDVTLGREVAFKVLHHSLMAHTVEQRMLVREARIMASLDHRSIPVIHDLGRDRHARPYFTMALVEGNTLCSLLASLRQEGTFDVCQLSTEQLIAYVLQTAEALSLVHRQGIVHGDIKPENVIVGHDGVVRLIDWGLATLSNKSAIDGDRLEAQWGRQGSPLYMSPEQVAGTPILQPSSDIYSLGVVLYECLTLRSPLRGKTKQETLQLVSETLPERPRRVAPHREIPSRLEEVCLRALSKSPVDRFPSMHEFCDSLRDCHLEMLIGYEF